MTLRVLAFIFRVVFGSVCNVGVTKVARCVSVLQTGVTRQSFDDNLPQQMSCPLLRMSSVFVSVTGDEPGKDDRRPRSDEFIKSCVHRYAALSVIRADFYAAYINFPRLWLHD